ncbi:MAG TPA: tRNA (N6-isopentenyl adenosine(37)-C2)-methylthiotransferase MiaB, partial [Desulfotomaculum sp.]|nr:tRNA (N6-isopentenyl adenosine(37)-C2)-methylthiotransferase MiaB [Desulfotomaculum sp.]
PETADLVLINTCCVRQTAENKVWGLLGNLSRLKRRRPGMVVGVTGCMAQQEGTAEEIRRRFLFVDLVIGTYNRHELARLLKRPRGEGPVVEILSEAYCIPEGLPVKRESRIRAWVPIMYGCDNFCAYCIVPYVRGRERSRRPEDIMREVKALTADGYREVVLLGQNVNAYGKGLDPPVDFASLLELVNEAEGLWRIRYTTSHPRDFSGRLVETAARLEKVCENFHLPVQAGSDRILKLMRRGYTRDGYLDLIRNIRRAVPGASITTDIMVGFPGETEEDFKETLDLVREVRFDQAFTFVYNPRRGTTAASFPGQVPAAVKSRRIQELIAVQQSIARELNRAEEGRVHEVLVEGPSAKNPAKMTGRTRTNKTVVFPGGTDLTGRLATVRITAGRLTHLEGELARTS